MTPVGRVFMANLPRFHPVARFIVDRFVERLTDVVTSIQQRPLHGSARRLRDNVDNLDHAERNAT
jgi:hypothetical protein